MSSCKCAFVMGVKNVRILFTILFSSVILESFVEGSKPPRPDRDLGKDRDKILAGREFRLISLSK